MIRNFFINVFFLLPIWVIELVSLFSKDIKRDYSFDAQSKILFALMPKFDLHKVEDKEIPKVRDLINERRENIRLAVKTKKNVSTKDHYIGNNKNLLLREYIPYKTDNDNIILYFHGGGYVLNSVDTHNATVSYFSEKLRTKIFSLEYSLSPEKKFPFAMNEVLDSIDWLIQIGYKIENINLCGDSAGAHLAASVTHHLANENKENVQSQFLIYPMCDPGCNSESSLLFKEGYLLTKKAMEWFWDKFRRNLQDDENSSFNLLLLNPECKIPRTIIVTAGFDPLCDEAEKYAFLLHQNNNYVKQLHYPSLFHGFASMTRLKAAQKAVNDFLSEYKEIL